MQPFTVCLNLARDAIDLERPARALLYCWQLDCVLNDLSGCAFYSLCSDVHEHEFPGAWAGLACKEDVCALRAGIWPG